jgi:hypothetical protein
MGLRTSRRAGGAIEREDETMRLSKSLIGGVLVVCAALFVGACGSDDEEKPASVSACFVQCSDGLVSCLSGPGLTEANCSSNGESDCGGAPMATVLQSGCSCPGDGEADECKSPPAWYD